jgi:hypothetical protein
VNRSRLFLLAVIACAIGFMAYVYVDTRPSFERAGAFRAWCYEACARQCMPMAELGDRGWNQCACDRQSILAGCRP